MRQKRIVQYQRQYKLKRILSVCFSHLTRVIQIQIQIMQDLNTAQGPKVLKFLSDNCNVQISMDETQQQLTFKLINTKNKNIYMTAYNNSTIPEDLKVFLSNIKTVFEYIEVNKSNPEKVFIKETGQVHIIFLLAFGPQSQIKKQIILEIQLKEIGKVEGSNIQELGERLRIEMIELNKKNKDERDKLKAIILSVERTSQKLVCETEQLKMENIEYKHKLQVMEEKVVALEILLKDLYIKYEVLKEEQQQLQKKIQKTKLVAIMPHNMDDSIFKKQTHSNSQETKLQNKNSDDSFIQRIKALEEERDEQRKMFEQKLAQKEKQLKVKVIDIERNQLDTAKQANSEVELLNSYLKDSEIQKLRNTVSPQNSDVKSDKSQKYSTLDAKYSGNAFSITPPKRKIGLTGKYYCTGQLCNVQNCPKCKGACGPNLGENCAKCMRMDIDKKGLKKGFLVNGNGQVAMLQNGCFSCGVGLQNGAYNCGIEEKYCQACMTLTENYLHRYKELLQ